MFQNQKIEFLDLSDSDDRQQNQQLQPTTQQSSNLFFSSIASSSSQSSNQPPSALEQHEQIQKQNFQQDLIDMFSDGSANNDNKIMSISHQDKDQYQIQVEEEQKNSKQESQQQQIPQQRVSCCSFAYYQYFFDIDIATFLYRLTNSLWPFTKRPFLTRDDNNVDDDKKSQLPITQNGQNLNIQQQQTNVSSKQFRYRYDLYGPIWIPTTLIVLLSLSSYAMSHPTFDVMKILAIGYVTYGTLLIFPLIFFLVLKCQLAGEDALARAKQKRLGYYQFLSVYGYSFAAYFVPGLFGLINVSLVKWILLSLSTFVALWMLNKEFGDLLMTKRNAQNQRVGESGMRNKTLLTIRIFVCLVEVAYMLTCGLYFLSD